MKKIFDNIITTIINIFITVVTLGTIYFALDVYNIINIPEQYSIANYVFEKFGINEDGTIIIEDSTDTDSREELIKHINDKLTELNNTTSSDNMATQDTEKNHDLLDALNALDAEQENTTTYVESAQVLTDVNSMAMYYDQLDEYGKIIYNRIYDNLNDLKTGTYTFDFGTTFNDLLNTDGGMELLNNDFQYAVNAITYDNPEFFYVEIPKIYLKTQETTKAFSKTYNVSIGGNGESYLKSQYSDAESINNALAQVEQVKNDILSAVKGKKDYDQIKYIHDYLVDNTEYDETDDSTAYDIYGTLIKHKCVCEGYARTFKYLLDELGIPCIIVCGIGQNSQGVAENHAWNYVKLNNIWYAVDVTWDDPIIIGNGKINDTIKYRYFLKGSETIGRNHFEDGNITTNASFKYPVLSQVDY